LHLLLLLSPLAFLVAPAMLLTRAAALAFLFAPLPAMLSLATLAAVTSLLLLRYHVDIIFRFSN
jgi:hypothetical protein